MESHRVILVKRKKRQKIMPSTSTEINSQSKKLPITTGVISKMRSPTKCILNVEKKKIEKHSSAKSETSVLENLANEEGIKIEPCVSNEKATENNDTWLCSKCSLINTSQDLTCTLCTYQRSSSNLRNHYAALLELDNSDIVLNFTTFQCPICFENVDKGNGIVLKNCLHSFCRECLAETIKFSEDPQVKCPFMNNDYSCSSFLQDLEIKSLISKELYEKQLEKSIKLAENQSEDAFHCKTPNCSGWCINEGEVNEFLCPVCKFQNCLSCKAIHTGLSCMQYQNRLHDDGPNTFLQNMFTGDEIMQYPTCKVVITKLEGCDYIQCCRCKTDICWATKQRRWGPAGHGDISGGCKCKVNGILCHPKCKDCH